MVTAAMTASSVSPPALRMSMPLPRALTPLALEIMSGRLPLPARASGCAALASAAAFGTLAPNSLPAPATALPASDVRKNLRRDQSFIGLLLTAGETIQARRKEEKLARR